MFKCMELSCRHYNSNQNLELLVENFDYYYYYFKDTVSVVNHRHDHRARFLSSTNIGDNFLYYIPNKIGTPNMSSLYEFYYTGR
jgi:hypothetical protein